MSITRHHNDWLRLVPNSGPFLSLPVLASAFPQGLDAHDADHARRLRLAFDEWDDNQLSQRPDPSLHRAWIKFVLGETLGYEELLAEGQEILQALKSDVAEYGETLRPDWIVNDPATKKPRLLIQVYPRSQSLTKPVAGRRWNAWPDGRMMQLLHDTGIRLGIVTNGDHWMLVNAPKNETTGYASWYANLWLEEPVTLRAFRTILGADRLFSVPDNETLEVLLDKSANDQQEVTDQLGYQVRKAVEVLIQALDKADQEHGRKLLGDVNEKVLYESALTVMMRLVFLFCAEERELLLLGDDLYDKNYAVSTLREQLRVTADQFGEEILGLRYDAWTRLLTTFRAVYAGAKHDRLKLPAYGGSLFNPDRFPFLEGRKLGTNWKNTEATPLPVSNRTVLHLLEALQVLQTKIGNTTEARKISFRALDIEQIGHVYEGLLDHTAKRATEPVLGLSGTRDKEPEIALAELEKIAAKGEKELLKFLKDESGRSESAIKKGLNAEIDDQLASRFRTVCQDSDLWKRVKPFAGLVRLDDVDYPVVITTGSVFVTAGTDRRSSGTHYTPKSLTEPIVEYTLEPLVKIGPAEGLPKEQWTLRSAKELLDLKICDMACGSGAFLVQACRYMAARLLEAWDAVQRANPGTVRITPEGQPSTGKPGEMLIPDDPDERQTYALRIVAQRCLYGVDKNPLAAEMAKLSLWLLTLAKDKPFEFLDHSIRCGDSLVGLHSIDQLRHYSLKPDADDAVLFKGPLDSAVDEAINLRLKLEDMPANTVGDVQRQEKLLIEANEKIARLRCAADLLVAAEFWGGNARDKLERVRHAAVVSGHYIEQGPTEEFQRVAREAWGVERAASAPTAPHAPPSTLPFHWPLEFPEVIVKRGGFDAFVGNPPFMGGKIISATFGDAYLGYLKTNWSHRKGSADYCAYFFLRAMNALSDHGTTGLIATNSISQGDTREVCLDYLLSCGATLFRAFNNYPWPGLAAVAVNVVHFTKSPSKIQPILDGHAVPYISGLLGSDQVIGDPYRLSANADEAFQGTIVLGEGFIVTPEEANDLIAKDARNRDVLFPYLDGQDLNSRVDQSPSRWIINFFDWPLERTQTYPDCLSVLTERVKSFRDEIVKKGKQIHEYDYWKFWDKRLENYRRLTAKQRVLVVAQTTKYMSFCFVPTTYVYSMMTIVFIMDGDEDFALLSSTIHDTWVRCYSSTLETRLRYTPSKSFETFPCPASLSGLAGIGKTYNEYRQSVMTRNVEGLTPTYNRFHDPDETSTDIQRLRELHVEMDQSVAAAYGWTDLELGHGFHETKQGVRFTISEPARREVLQRLLKLNHERYAEEVKQGLHGKKGAKATASTKKLRRRRSTPQGNAQSGPALFDTDELR